MENAGEVITDRDILPERRKRPINVKASHFISTGGPSTALRGLWDYASSFA